MHPLSGVASLLVLTLPLATLPLAAQARPEAGAPATRATTRASVPAPDQDELRARRARLMQEAGSGVILVRGGGTNADMGSFAQNQDLYYLVGSNEPNQALLLFPETKEEILFVPPFNPRTAKWEGERIVPGERGVAATGIARVVPGPQLLEELGKALAPAPGKGDAKRPLWTPRQPSPGRGSTPGQTSRAVSERGRDELDGRASREEALCQALERRFAGIEIADLTPLLHRLRGTKQKDEVACVTHAAKAAALGIAEAMRICEPGLHEFELAATARYVHDRMGANGDAYGAIVGAGRNGCVLHYMANTKLIEADDLIVMDYAPTVANYCADVTRTFPASGKFTAAQRKLVQDVHEIQAELVGMVKPGVSMGELEQASNRLLRERGYQSAHGMSHHVGLAVHDVGGDILEPGMVITVEPGAYLTKEGMGCRIEDTVLVTETGHVVLSAACPSSPDEIEKLMAAKARAKQPAGAAK